MHLAFNQAPSELPEIDNIRIPRWLQIVSGVVIGVFSALCAAATLIILVSLFWHRGTKFGQFVALSTICALLTGAGSFLFWVSHRLLTGREKRGGYSSPRALRMTSYALVVLALLVLVLSLQPPRNLTELIAALGYLLIAGYLLKLASKWENLEHNQLSEPTLASGTAPAGQDPRHR